MSRWRWCGKDNWSQTLTTYCLTQLRRPIPNQYVTATDNDLGLQLHI